MDVNKNSTKQATKADAKADAKVVKTPDVVLPKCTTTKCNGIYHKPEGCFILHPELRNATKESLEKKKGMVAMVQEPEKFDDDIKNAIIATQIEYINSLEAKMAAKSENEVQTSKNIKPIYIDSGNNYSLIQSITHIDINSNIFRSPSNPKVETAGGQ